MQSAPSVKEGDLLAGKYRIDKVLGVGGMGVVVAAHHIGLDERVAIKFLLPEMLKQEEAVARFSREARAAVKIKSEHVARVSDVGTLEDGAPYLVMEYLDGSDLAGWLKQSGALPLEQAVEFVLQACEAVAEAHALGIVHRDLKPANLFVIRRPEGTLSVKVLDFGISKMRSAGGSLPDVSITKTSAMMGSPLYMSPEQLQSAKDVDARADIWALGVILYELVSGVPPFMAEGVAELVAHIFTLPAPPLSQVKASVPAAVEAVISRCLEKDRNRRFESVGELAQALAPYAPRRSRVSLDRISGVMRSAGLPGANTALPPSSGSDTTGAVAGTQGSWGKTKSPGKRTGATLITGLTAAALGGIGYYVLRSPAPAVPPPPSLSAAAPAPSNAEPTLAEPSAPPPEVVPAAASVLPSSAPVASAAPAAAQGRPASRERPISKAPAPAAPPGRAAASPTVTVAPAPSPPRPAAEAFDDRK